MPARGVPERAHVTGVEQSQQHRRHDRQCRQHVRGDPNLAGDRTQVAPELFPRPHGCRDELEELGQAAADLPLDGDCIEHELEVGRPDPPAELGERVFERPAQVHLGHDPLELPSGRFTDIGGDGLEPVVEPVTGTERGRERVEDLRQLLLERTRAPEGANVQHKPRCDERGRTAQHCHAD